jgi:hypothetical protein
MSALILLALVLLGLAGALFFGPYLVVYGASGFRDLARRDETRLIGLILIAALSLAVFTSGSDPALISGSETVQLVPQTITGPVPA